MLRVPEFMVLRFGVLRYGSRGAARMVLVLGLKGTWC